MRSKWQQIGEKHATDKATAHQYMPIYEEVLQGFEVERMLEIGVWFGYSMNMWREIFPDAFVLGIDIEPKYPKDAPYADNVMIANATDKEQMVPVKELGPFDLIVDDGSHIITEIKDAYRALNDSCRGFYVIEDLTSSSFPEIKKLIGDSIFIEGAIGTGLIIKDCR